MRYLILLSVLFAGLFACLLPQLALAQAASGGCRASQLPSSLGAKPAANSVAVNIASDQIVPVKQSDAPDATNSSTTLLANAAVFTGTWVSTLGYGAVVVNVASDQVSAANGLQIQFSTNANNVDDVFSAPFVDTTVGQTFAVPTKAQYYRVVYTNGGVTQAVFRLASILRMGELQGDIGDLADTLNPNDHAGITHTLTSGRTTGAGAAFADDTVKAASTAAAVTDTSRVVQLSPNQAQLTTPLNVQEVPLTAAGNAVSALGSATVTTAVVVKASAGNVYGLSVANGAATVCWVQFLNASSAPTLGTAIVFAVALPASGVVTIPPGTFALGNFSAGISMGIGLAATG